MPSLFTLFVVCAALSERPLRSQFDDLDRTVWTVTSTVLDGKEAKLEEAEKRIVITSRTVSVFAAKELISEFRLKTDDGDKPKSVDLTDSEGFVWRGIYEAEGDMLKVCLIWAYRRNPDRERPVSFETRGRGTVLFVLRKIK